jgi:triphosphatase
LDGTDILQPISQGRAAPMAQDVSARDALRAIMQECAGRVRIHMAGLGAGSSHALHEMRGALRRWRTALTVFDELLTPEGRRLQRELKWLAGKTNAARDLDVLAPRVQARAGAEGAEELAAALEAARAEAYAGVEEALRSERARRLVQAGRRPGRAEVLIDAGETSCARRLAAKALSWRRRQLRRSGKRLREMSPPERHHLRIQAKKTRYTAELFGDLFGHGRRQKRLGGELKSLQDVLGELNDVRVGAALAAQLAVRAGAPEAAFQAGVIAGDCAAGEAALLKQARKAYDRLVDARPFW